jgi:hypothetical protein
MWILVFVESIYYKISVKHVSSIKLENVFQCLSLIFSACVQSMIGSIEACCSDVLLPWGSQNFQTNSEIVSDLK